MPTEKPRFTITTSKPIFETVSRLAQLQGVSKSHVVNDLLEAVHPPLMRTVALLEAASDAPQQVRSGLRQTVLDMERELAGSVGSSINQMDWLTAKLRDAPEGQDSSGPGAPRSGADSLPPHSNTGVRRPTGRINTKKAKTRQGGKRG